MNLPLAHVWRHSLRILVVDDEETFSYGLRINLEQEGYGVHVAIDPDAALRMLDVLPFNLLIVDLMLPGREDPMSGQNGLGLVRKLRSRGCDLPILILSGRASVEDRVNGLRAGADDYLCKPFSLKELFERVLALLRRSGLSRAQLYCFGPFTLRPATRTLTRGRVSIHLTPKEYDLLQLLVVRAGEVVSKREIMTSVWGITAELDTKTIETHITRLRRKLDPVAGFPSCIGTVSKFGYRLVLPVVAGKQ